MWDEVSVSASFSMIISMTIAAMNSLQSKSARVVLCILETQSTRTRQYAILRYRAPPPGLCYTVFLDTKAMLLANQPHKAFNGNAFQFLLVSPQRCN